MKEIVHHCCSCIYKDGKKHIRLTDDDSFFHMFQFFFTNNGKKNLAVLDWWFCWIKTLICIISAERNILRCINKVSKKLLYKKLLYKKQTPAVNFKPYRCQNERSESASLAVHGCNILFTDCIFCKAHIPGQLNHLWNRNIPVYFLLSSVWLRNM